MPSPSSAALRCFLLGLLFPCQGWNPGSRSSALSGLYYPSAQTSRLSALFTDLELIPDVVQSPPLQVLKVDYRTGVSAELGNELRPTDIRCQPEVIWQAEPWAYYTLVMIDPDSPSRSDRSTGQVRHWLVTNITHRQTGDVITEYIGSGALQGSGLHRYVFLVYRQQGPIEVDPSLRQTFRQVSGRFRWNVEQFARQHGLGRPVAGNVLQARYDDYVPVLYAQFIDFP